MPHQCTTCGHVFDDGSKEMLSGCPDCGGNTFQFHPKGTEIPETPPDAEPPEPEGSTAANTVGRAATKVRDFVSSDSGTGADSTAGAPERPPADPGRVGDPAASGSVDGGGDGTGTAGAGSGTGSTPDPNATWPSEQEGQDRNQDSELEPDDDGIIDADAREAARAVSEADEADTTDAPAEMGDSAQRDELAQPGEPPQMDGPTRTDEPDGADGVGPVASTEHGGAAGRPTGGPSEGRVVSEPDDDHPDIAELREQLNDQFESIKILEPGQYELNLMELYDREEYIIALQENGRYVIQVPEQWLGDQPGDA